MLDVILAIIETLGFVQVVVMSEQMPLGICVTCKSGSERYSFSFILKGESLIVVVYLDMDIEGEMKMSLKEFELADPEVMEGLMEWLSNRR